jgi:hypothetical protein
MTELKVLETMDLPALPHTPLWWAAWLNTAAVLQLSLISKIVWKWQECKTWRWQVNVWSNRATFQLLVTISRDESFSSTVGQSILSLLWTKCHWTFYFYPSTSFWVSINTCICSIPVVQKNETGPIRRHVSTRMFSIHDEDKNQVLNL